MKRLLLTCVVIVGLFGCAGKRAVPMLEPDAVPLEGGELTVLAEPLEIDWCFPTLIHTEGVCIVHEGQTYAMAVETTMVLDWPSAYQGRKVTRLTLREVEKCPCK